MRIFLAGATGVIGSRLLPKLIEAGHEVVAMSRSAKNAETIRATGAKFVVGDAFKSGDLDAIVAAAKPDVMIHQLTSLPKRIDPSNVANDLIENDRLRVLGTKNLVSAAEKAKCKRVIAQSIAFAYEPSGTGLKVETDLLFGGAPKAFSSMITAVISLERTVLKTAGIEGVVLRYGYFYGPGTVYASNGTFAEDVKNRKVPIIGEGTGVFSFIHINDAVQATLNALTAPPGVYNVVDDEPAAIKDWLPYYAQILKAKEPKNVGKFFASFGAGAYGMYLMLEQKGASNAKAKQQLNLQLKYPSWRKGFQEDLGPIPR
jgi:nucleoside-diphosphate-sugar epimerase